MIKPKLTLPMIEQIEFCIEISDRDCSYYGPKKLYEKRREKILLWLGYLREELK